MRTTVASFLAQYPIVTLFAVIGIGYLLGEDGVLLADVAPGGNAILALAAETRSKSARVA